MITLYDVYSMRCVYSTADHPLADIVIARCHRGEKWTSFNPKFEIFSWFEDIILKGGTSRVRRFIISGPVAITATIGTLLFTRTTIRVSYAVANTEVNRVAEQQNILRVTDKNNTIKNNLLNYNVSQNLRRSIDDLRFQEAIAAQTDNLYFQSTALVTESNHLFEDSKIGLYIDPKTEIVYNVMFGFVESAICSLSQQEYEGTTKLTTGVSSIIMNLGTKDGTIKCCSKETLTKT